MRIALKKVISRWFRAIVLTLVDCVLTELNQCYIPEV